jgi:hypothetical protein
MKLAYGEWITLEETSLRESDSTIRWKMIELHDCVMLLRNSVPPTANGLDDGEH